MTIAIHGFLGLPTDWKNATCITPNLWDSDPKPFDTWAADFNGQYNGTIMGYSLGGRLALHALLNNPDNWEKAIIISAHPGLDESLRSARFEDDQRWANRFASDPWHSLMHDWNSRPVFTFDPPVIRNESDFSRQRLSQALTTWSLGRQKKLHHEIAKLHMPIIWVVGEKDLPFLSESKSLKFKNPHSKLIVMPNMGHRIALELVAKISF